MKGRPPDRDTPTIIHVINIIALLLGGAIVFLTAIVGPYALFVLIPVLGLLAVYWRFRRDPNVVAAFFGLAMALMVWILICEHIVILDNILGTQISRHLNLGVRLNTYALRTLRSGDHIERVPCCGDSLTWRYRPGSLYRITFDCPGCNEPYDVIVDEAGYLNQPRGLFHRSQQIDLFLAGDSVLQGMGVPSVVEVIRPQIPLGIWNLSIQAYGPRQKIGALLTYALPKQPRWLLLEFYAGNDIPEAIRDDVCAAGTDFRCRYNKPEIYRRLAQHPVYSTIFRLRDNVWVRLAHYSTENLTLATTRYLFTVMKGVIKRGFAGSLERPSVRRLSQAASPPAPVRDGQWLTYLKAGMALTEQQYERLASALERLDPKPGVVLLYNPSPYEVYAGLKLEPNPEADQTSAFQRRALSVFARKHAWQILDLTEPLRREVHTRQSWLYGEHDRSHWSSDGTMIVAGVLAPELLKIITPRKRHSGASPSRRLSLSPR